MYKKCKVTNDYCHIPLKLSRNGRSIMITECNIGEKRTKHTLNPTPNSNRTDQGAYIYHYTKIQILNKSDKMVKLIKQKINI